MTMIDPNNLRERLDEILPSVQSPSRYLGLERNLTRKPWDSVALRVALAFPDAYEIGMSHQGTRILYHLINRRDDALAERTFAPMPDMADAIREAELPLYTLESYHAVGDFDVVGISLQSELNYINVPYILDLAGITRRADRRSDSEPLVIGGGPCTANPGLTVLGCRTHPCRYRNGTPSISSSTPACRRRMARSPFARWDR